MQAAIEIYEQQQSGNGHLTNRSDEKLANMYLSLFLSENGKYQAIANGKVISQLNSFDAIGKCRIRKGNAQQRLNP